MGFFKNYITFLINRFGTCRQAAARTPPSNTNNNNNHIRQSPSSGISHSTTSNETSLPTGISHKPSSIPTLAAFSKVSNIGRSAVDARSSSSETRASGFSIDELMKR